MQEAENGGAACPALEEEESCNTEPCPGYFSFLRNNFLSLQLTAKLKIGHHGPTAARPAEVEPRPEAGELFERLITVEQPVQLWRKSSLATLTNAQVIFLL